MLVVVVVVVAIIIVKHYKAKDEKQDRESNILCILNWVKKTCYMYNYMFSKHHLYIDVLREDGLRRDETYWKSLKKKKKSQRNLLSYGRRRVSVNAFSCNERLGSNIRIFSFTAPKYNPDEAWNDHINPKNHNFFFVHIIQTLFTWVYHFLIFFLQYNLRIVWLIAAKTIQ